MLARTFAAAAFAVALAVRPAVAVEFIRGDANGDRVVSIADARLVLNYYLEFGPKPTCMDAADANDNGDVDISDAAAILVVLFLEGVYRIPAPHPDPGPDPTDAPNEPLYPDVQPMKCDAWGDVRPMADPLARIALVAGDAAGGDPSRVMLTVTASCSTATAGLAAEVRLPPGLIAGVASAEAIATGRPGNAELHDGRLSLWILSSMPIGNVFEIPAGEDIPVLEVTLCLAQGAPAGSYDLELAAAELVDAASSRAIPAATSGATLTLADDVAVASDCGGSPPPPPPPLPPLEAKFALAGAVGPPGDTVSVTLLMRADAEIQGWAYSVSFDETLLDAVDTTPLWKRPDGSAHSFLVLEMDNDDDVPGDGGVDEGFLVGACVIDFVGPAAMPANVDNEVVRFDLAIDENAGAVSTELSFVDGGQGSGEPVPNMVIANGRSEYTAGSPGTFIFLTGHIEVLPDIITFLRGDANGDGVLDLSDAQATFGYLFLGDGEPWCADAADANDDGRLDISDPVATLGYLFLGARQPPSPFPLPGSDTTADGLLCRSRS